MKDGKSTARETQLLAVADRFGVLACFDDDENSDTYSERVGRCPGCGAWVNAKELLVTYEGRG